jgi:integrase
MTERSDGMARKRRGRGEGSISQRPDGLWVARISLGYKDGNKRRRRVVYGKTKQEVQEKLRKLQDEAAAGLAVETDRLTLAAFLTTWLETVRQKVCRSTHRRYEQHVNGHLVPHLGAVQLRKLTAYHISQLYNDMEKKGASASERRKVGTALRMALKHAVRLRLVSHNPAADVPKPRAPKQEMHVLVPEQIPVFLKAAESDRLYALYVLALDGGMRQGEIFGLRWADVDIEAASVQVQRSLEEVAGRLELKDVKTAKGRRRVQLSPFTAVALHEHRKRMLVEGHAKGDSPVFCDTEGKWLRKSNFFRRSFQPLLDRVTKALEQSGQPGLPHVRFHDLRHTVASLLLLSGENPKVVSERLGHASIEVTLNTYSHVLPTMQQAAAEKLGRILSQPLPQKRAE